MKFKPSLKFEIDFHLSMAMQWFVYRILRIIGIVVNVYPYFTKTVIRDRHTISRDGRYGISCAQNGHIYLISFGAYPIVISFDSGCFVGCEPPMFSKDMNQIIIKDTSGTTILSAVPGAGFERRPVLIAEPECSIWPMPAKLNIVEYIWCTSSAYWKFIPGPNKKPWKPRLPLPTPSYATAFLPTFDWDKWVSVGERYWDRVDGKVPPRL
jgi:hypothetical protein